MNLHNAHISIGDAVLAPSKTYIAKAIPVEDGYIAQFSTPGLIPRYVSRAHDPNTPIVFETAEEAENEARRAMMGILNTPRKNQARGKNERYRKMSGEEFAVELADAGIGLTLFAYIYGTSVTRVQSWIDGTENVPHPVRILLALFRNSAVNIDIAEEVTQSVTTERRPRRQG